MRRFYFFKSKQLQRAQFYFYQKGVIASNSGLILTKGIKAVRIGQIGWDTPVQQVRLNQHFERIQFNFLVLTKQN